MSSVYNGGEHKCILNITVKKGFFGLLLGSMAFYVCQRYYYSPTFGLTFALLFALPGFFCIKVKNEKWNLALQFALGIFIIAVCSGAVIYVLRKLFYEKGLFDLGFIKLLCNLMFSLIVCCVIYFVTGKWALSVSISSFFITLLALINGFVIQFRGREICMDDLLSVGTAMSVAGEYTYYVPAYMAFCFVLWAALAFWWLSMPPFPRVGFLRSRLSAFVAALAAFGIMHLASYNIQPAYWGAAGTIVNGIYLNMYLGFRDSFVKVPDYYSPEKAEELVAEYSHGQTATQKENLPNVLVIMNESFADFESFPNPPTFSTPVTPYLDSLSENLICGKALCSVYGGNTANSEFEFLFGHTMAFLPNSITVVPYQQYLGDEIYALPQLMKSMGYDTFATHPYKPGGWMRDSRYPTFGFSNSTFIDAYPQENLVREYVSDREMYEYVLDILCADEQKAPLFLFGITMQNHGGYDYKGNDFSKSVEISGSEGQYPLTEQYLSLINESDKALGYLIEELKSFEENTVLLFFGDHLPKVEDSFYNRINGGVTDSIEEQQLMHTIPFYIWANYDILESKIELTSLNYLSTYLLEAAGIELPPYYSFLKDTEAIIPAINAYGYYSLSHQRYLPIAEADGKEAQALENYKIMQHNNIFDKKNRSYTAFGAYMTK